MKNTKLLRFACALLTTTACCFAEDGLKNTLSDSEQRIQKLEAELNKEINRNNAIRAKLAGQADTVIPESSKAEEHNLTELVKKVKTLEEDVARLKGLKLDGSRTEAEALATKDAQAHAPQLDVNSPLLAQYNQASSLYAKGELALAREAFMQITKTSDVPATDMYVTRSWQHLGEIHKKEKNFRLSEEAYKEALKRPLPMPMAIECRLGISETLMSLGETKEACDHVAALEKMEKQHMDPSQKARLASLSDSCKPKVEKKHTVPAAEKPSEVRAPVTTPATVVAPNAAGSLTPQT
jgi:TolA-binding protein